MPPARDPVERFWEKVEKTDSCWLWTAGTFKSGGYGQHWADGKPVRAHRFAYELMVGPIPDGMVLCHHCDVPACVRPDHMFIGTRHENSLDMARKGRGGAPKGSNAGDRSNQRTDARRARRDEVLRLRAEGVRQSEIARRLGMTQGNVSHIVNGKSWH
jgi:hypothetical protein